MLPSWEILHAMLHCRYKAWQLAKNRDNDNSQGNSLALDKPIELPTSSITAKDKLAVAALYKSWHISNTNSTSQTVSILLVDGKVTTLKPGLNSIKADNLLTDTLTTISQELPPAFYKNKHCSECQYWSSCYKLLQERNCISLLSGMSQKVILRFHKKGIFSISQLSCLFRPRRRRRQPKVSSNYLWELKALAITEKKTFVLSEPEIKETEMSFYLDFEGLPDEGWIYLIGLVASRRGHSDNVYSFWANGRDDEKEAFTCLFTVLKQIPDAPIFHYGSYEIKELKRIQRKWPEFKDDITGIQVRMVNLLGFLRNNVYPPIYSNGLKELANFLGFNWSQSDASGLQTISWRKKWEVNKREEEKEVIVGYNLEDCYALIIVKKWLIHLAGDTKAEGVQKVTEMQRASPYKLHNNPQLGEDFQLISKAAYFDYQRTRIYLKNKSAISKAATIGIKPKSAQKGIMVWQPSKINEVITLTPLNACPRCGSSKVYQYKKKIRLVQTDLKFTPTGIRQHVVEYLSTRAKCGNCYKQYNNHNFRRLHYGSNVFAYATNLYISYNISNYMISKIMQEQFGIWINPMYLVMRKEKWWKEWQPEVDYIWKTILNSPVIHIDETSIHLDNKSGYVWVFATTHTVFYHYTDTREGDFLHDWLKGYQGVIVTDFFPSYESLPIMRQKCLIHLIRDLNDDLFKSPFDEEFKKMVIGFNDLLKKIIVSINQFGLNRKHLNKHVLDTDYFRNHHVEQQHKSELSKKYAKRFQKHWEQLWTFLHNDGVPWNNNNAEAAVKAFAQYRRCVKGQIGEHGLREYLKMLSIAQTCRYRNIQFLSFLRRRTGLWKNIPAEAMPNYLPFNQARIFAQKLKLQLRKQWQVWARTEKRPSFIPQSPDKVYKNEGWINWADWLGVSFLPFEKARAYMRRLGLKNRHEYREWLMSGKRPKTIPHEPHNVYKHTGWNGLGDWLGNGNIQNQKKIKLPYEQARAYVQAIGIKTWQEYVNWSKSGDRPASIPAAPDKAYHEFKSWGDFLGTMRIANQNKEFWDYDTARTYLSTLNVRSRTHFVTLCKNGMVPDEIPRDPKTHYKKCNKWIGYREFWGKASSIESASN